MIPRHDNNIHGVDDFVAEVALARRARWRAVANGSTSLCERRFTHPRWPAQLDAHGYLLVDTCSCTRPCGHGDSCVCEHNVERRVIRVDPDGREHYATRPLA